MAVIAKHRTDSPSCPPCSALRHTRLCALRSTRPADGFILERLAGGRRVAKPAYVKASRSNLQEQVRKLWPELEWIRDTDLRDKVERTWSLAFERSPLSPKDLDEIPFTLLIPDCPTSFMEHKRCVVHIARGAAEAMKE